ncbi:MAG: hypothetical protein R6X22_03555 [Gemmatimonadota bacterium]
MDRILKADGDTWRAELGAKATEDGRRALVFFCASNDQRPYRVVEVSGTEMPDADALARLGSAEIEGLFDRSVSMGTRVS